MKSNFEKKFSLRAYRPDDKAWVVDRHFEIYAQEFGWTEKFRTAVQKIVEDFEKNFNPEREYFWIAEIKGQRVGCVFLMEESADTARIRLVLVEPEARGMGLGRALVDDCESFAKSHAYKKIVLFTNSVLTSARKIYEAAGYKMIHQEKHSNYGPELMGQTWLLEL